MRCADPLSAPEVASRHAAGSPRDLATVVASCGCSPVSIPGQYFRVAKRLTSRSISSPAEASEGSDLSPQRPPEAHRFALSCEFQLGDAEKAAL